MNDDRENTPSKVTIAVEYDLLVKVIAVLTECGEDLHAEVRARYGHDKSPTGKRRCYRDMEPSIRALQYADQLAHIIS